jgi:hypothetical protein
VIRAIRYETGRVHGFWLGRSAPFGVWRTRQARWMWVHDHDSLFVAAARWRMRISKPGARR